MRKRDIKKGDRLLIGGELNDVEGIVIIISQEYIYLRVGHHRVRTHHSMLRPREKVEKEGL